MIRLLHHDAAPGRWNMAVDETLAVHGAEPFHATLRFYGWSPATLSLGHHQDASVVDAAALRARSLGLVRRPTGGMAVLHDQELTLALAGPDIARWGLDLGDTVALLADALAAALRARGHDGYADPGRSAATRADGITGSACFSGGGRHEVWIGGRKIAGLAARRWGRAFLVHGSFLLGRSHLALPELLRLPPADKEMLRTTLELRTVCLEELEAGGASRGDEVAAAVAAGIARVRGLALEPGVLLPTEERAISDLLEQMADLVAG